MQFDQIVGSWFSLFTQNLYSLPSFEKPPYPFSNNSSSYCFSIFSSFSLTITFSGILTFIFVLFFTNSSKPPF